MASEALLVSYLLRVVRIGVVCTFVVVVAVAVYPLLDPTVPITHPGLYWTVVVVAPLGAAAVTVLPWRRMLASRWPLAGFHLWSVGDIVLISLLVAASGGAVSPLWAVYTLTTLFFAASYPRRSQMALFAFTVAAYVVAVAAVSEQPLTEHGGEIVLNVGILLTVALMAGFISAELRRQMETQARRAQAASRVSSAAAQIGRLDLDRVMDAAVDAASDVGLPLSAAVVFQGNTYRVLASRGLPENFELIRLVVNEPPAGADVWVLPRSEVGDPEVAALLEQVGCDVILAAPLVVASTTVGLFAAGAVDDPVAREVVATLGVIVSQAMENAELYRLKTDFVANVSHELRTPLTVLVGMGQTLRGHAERLSPQQLAELAARIEASAARLHRLITDLLDFSRLEAGSERVRREPVDLGALVRVAVERRQEELATRQVDLVADPGAVAVGDAAMLERVVDNLLANVAAHTPTTTTARVSVRRLGDEVEVAVEDDGPGIPLGTRVTERFTRVGDHLTRGTAGLGLGLALAHEILVLHGSELVIGASDLGGARASFRLHVPIGGDLALPSTPSAATEA